MLPQKYRFTAENAEGAEATYLLLKGFSATSAISAVKKAFFAFIKPKSIKICGALVATQSLYSRISG
jgi:hypothetical protein